MHNNKILEKPESKEEAYSFIRCEALPARLPHERSARFPALILARARRSGYGQSPCSTVGATVVTNLRSGSRFEAVDVAAIHFRSASQAALSAQRRQVVPARPLRSAAAAIRRRTRTSND